MKNYNKNTGDEKNNPGSVKRARQQRLPSLWTTAEEEHPPAAEQQDQISTAPHTQTDDQISAPEQTPAEKENPTGPARTQKDRNANGEAETSAKAADGPHPPEEQPARIGKRLTEAREKCGLSRENVSKSTRIPLNVIAKLEEERLAELPPFLYAKSYLEKLCRHYGIAYAPLGAILAEYNQRTQKKSSPGKFCLAQDENSFAPKVQYFLQAQEEPKKSNWLSATPSMLVAIIATALLAILISMVLTVHHIQQPGRPENSAGSPPAEGPGAPTGDSEDVDLEQLIIPHPLPLKELEVPDN